MMDIALIGATILWIAALILFVVLISLMAKSTVDAYKDKDMKGLGEMLFVWFATLGFVLLIVGSV